MGKSRDAVRGGQLFLEVVAKKPWSDWVTRALEHFGHLTLRRSWSFMDMTRLNRFLHWEQR
jgi:hypothetical protein